MAKQYKRKMYRGSASLDYLKRAARSIWSVAKDHRLTMKRYINKRGKGEVPRTVYARLAKVHQIYCMMTTLSLNLPATSRNMPTKWKWCVSSLNIWHCLVSNRDIPLQKHRNVQHSLHNNRAYNSLSTLNNITGPECLAECFSTIINITVWLLVQKRTHCNSLGPCLLIDVVFESKAEDVS